MALGLFGRQIAARGADHRGDFQLEVEPGAAGGDGHIVVGADDGGGVGEVEGGDPVPDRLQRSRVADCFAAGAQVVEEAQAVPYGWRPGEGGFQRDVGERDDVSGLGEGALARLPQRGAEESEQGGAFR
nr:hypothetical protein [Streptomyces sp. ID38640]